MKRTPIRRDTPKAREFAYGPRKPIARKTRLRPRGKRHKRRKAAGEIDSDLARYVRDRPCCICRRHAPSEAHHVRSRGSGRGDWLSNGDGNLTPLCRRDHRMVERSRRFTTPLYGLVEKARAIGEEWKRRNA